MGKFSVKLFTAILMFSFAGIISGQFGLEEDLVNINVYKSLDKSYAGSEVKIAVKISVNEGWHINSNKPHEDYLIPTEVKIGESSKFKFASIIYPKPEDLKFSFSDIPVSVYEGQVTIGGIIKVPADIDTGMYEVPVEFTYQACNNASCMAPNTITKTFTLEIVDNKSTVNEINSEIFNGLDLTYTKIDTKDEGSLGASLESSGLFLSLILIFLGGLALNLTPCVYPLIPITIGYFGGQTEGRTGKLFLLGILYMLGMALTYSVVGVVTSLSGAVFGTLLQNPIVIIFIVLVFIVLSLSMFGMYEFKLPDSWAAKAGGARSGAFGAFFMGLTMGIVAAPCIGPFVIGLVTYVAAKGDPFYGFIMFFTMAIGLGFPYLLLALFSGKIKSLPKAGFWMDAVKKIFGFILIGMAIYFAGPLLPKEINFYLLPSFMILTAIYLLFIDKLANDIIGFRIFKSIFSVVVLIAALYMMWPIEKNAPDWKHFTQAAYEQSLADNNKMIIDFYADWCIPCKELDASTFSDPRVVDQSKNFTNLKVDMTKTMSDETEIVREKFNIKGMPTILIIDSNGNEIKRLTGFIDADEFLSVISKIK